MVIGVYGHSDVLNLLFATGIWCTAYIVAVIASLGKLQLYLSVLI